jgi:hypothetical protein
MSLVFCFDACAHLLALVCDLGLNSHVSLECPDLPRYTAKPCPSVQALKKLSLLWNLSLAEALVAFLHIFMTFSQYLFLKPPVICVTVILAAVCGAMSRFVWMCSWYVLQHPADMLPGTMVPLLFQQEMPQTLLPLGLVVFLLQGRLQFLIVA